MFCLWLFIHNGVPTKTFLCSRGIFIPNECIFATMIMKIFIIFLRLGSFSCNFRGSIKYSCPPPISFEGSFIELLSSIHDDYSCLSQAFKSPVKKIKKKLILVWNIWNHRNEVLFKGKTINSFAAINNYLGFQ